LGGLTGLVLLAISYVIQLPIPSSPDIKDLHPKQQEWYKKGSMIEILGKKMFTVSKGKCSGQTNKQTATLLIQMSAVNISISFHYFDCNVSF